MRPYYAAYLLLSYLATVTASVSHAHGGTHDHEHDHAAAERTTDTQQPVRVETFTRDISLSEGDAVRSVESMTGGITVRQGARVAGNVETEIGNLLVEPGAEVGGRLQNESGTITVDGARILRGVVTTYGDIYIGPDSFVKGGIVVNKRNVAGLSFGPLKLGVPVGNKTPPTVVIAPGATVEGKLRFKREVRLFVGEGATIGPIEGAEPVFFPGATPN